VTSRVVRASVLLYRLTFDSFRRDFDSDRVTIREFRVPFESGRQTVRSVRLSFGFFPAAEMAVRTRGRGSSASAATAD